MSKSTASTAIEPSKKSLYDYQISDLNRIFEVMENSPKDYNLLYQLPTGGGKTVVFSEIVRRYIKSHQKKVVQIATFHLRTTTRQGLRLLSCNR